VKSRRDSDRDSTWECRPLSSAAAASHGTTHIGGGTSKVADCDTAAHVCAARDQPVCVRVAVWLDIRAWNDRQAASLHSIITTTTSSSSSSIRWTTAVIVYISRKSNVSVLRDRSKSNAATVATTRRRSSRRHSDISDFLPLSRPVQWCRLYW